MLNITLTFEDAEELLEAAEDLYSEGLGPGDKLFNILEKCFDSWPELENRTYLPLERWRS